MNKKQTILKDIMDKNKKVVITICGSQKFTYDMRIYQDYYKSMGNIVYALCNCTSNSKYFNEEFLTKTYHEKISKSDAILIINKNGNIDELTINNFIYASELNKIIMYSNVFERDGWYSNNDTKRPIYIFKNDEEEDE